MQNGVIIGVFYLLIFLPFSLVLLHMSREIDQLKEYEEAVDILPLRMEKVKAAHKGKMAFIDTYRLSDPEYISHRLETMTFLDSEIEALKLVNNHAAFESCDNIKTRLELLTQGGNRFSFSETCRDVDGEIEEREFAQIQPVEINGNDLKRILVAVEGISIGKEEAPKGRPQMVIKSFTLDKKKLAERETYLLEMQLIKRGLLK